jgi:hypothetical protein
VNFPVLTGTSNPVINALPVLLLVAVIGGLGYALWLRSRDRQRYAALARAELREPAAEAEPVTKQPQPTTTSAGTAGSAE